MKKKLLFISLLIASALLFAQCKSCGCGYQPKKYKATHHWTNKKHR